ncbi:MAG: hypothetical protein HC882_10125 [Acidobacteria bacterium]|nr:hypothetical protein [Acidobacteriota bacterium]
MDMKHDQAPSVHSQQSQAHSAYETPEVQTFTAQQLLEVLGPAQGYGGGSQPPGRREGGLGRGHRLFPGLR